MCPARYGPHRTTFPVIRIQMHTWCTVKISSDTSPKLHIVGCTKCCQTRDQMAFSTKLQSYIWHLSKGTCRKTHKNIFFNCPNGHVAHCRNFKFTWSVLTPAIMHKMSSTMWSDGYLEYCSKFHLSKWARREISNIFLTQIQIDKRQVFQQWHHPFYKHICFSTTLLACKGAILYFGLPIHRQYCISKTVHSFFVAPVVHTGSVFALEYEALSKHFHTLVHTFHTCAEQNRNVLSNYSRSGMVQES